MKATISIAPGLAYGADEAVPDTQGGLSVGDAAYLTVHNHPGGVTALAARMGVSANTLTHKVNPNNTTHHLSLQEAVTMQHMAGDAAVLHAMADHLGYTCTRATPDQAGGDPVDAFIRLQCAVAEFVRAVGDPLVRVGAESAAAVSRNEVRRADYHAADLQATIGHMLAALRGKLRAVPGGGL